MSIDWDETRCLVIDGRTIISQTPTDPGDFGEPRVTVMDDVTYVSVPEFELWPTDPDWTPSTPTHCEGCNVHNICNGIAALDLASPDTVDVMARALQGTYDADLIDAPVDDAHRWCDEDSGGNHRLDSELWLRALAAALIEAIRQEMEKA